MENDVFKIILCDGKNEVTNVVTSQSLYETIDNFIDSNAYALFITKSFRESIKLEMQKYYKSKYNFLTRKYKSNKITEEEYTQAMNKLKKIKNESETVEEFKTKFNEYKKTLTIIPPYNVSDK